MKISPYTCGTMHNNWREDVVRAVDDCIKSTVMEHWPHTPEDYTRPRQEINELRRCLDWLHPIPAPNRDDLVGGQHHGDPRYYVLRDVMLMERCNFILSYISDTGNNLGGAQEIGWAYARGKPIITIDMCPDLQRFDTWRAVSLAVYTSVEEAARFIVYLIQAQGAGKALEVVEFQLESNGVAV